MSNFIKVASLSMQKYSIVNAKIDKENVFFRNYVDISVAVGGPQGLITNIIKIVNQ